MDILELHEPAVLAVMCFDSLQDAQLTLVYLYLMQVLGKFDDQPALVFVEVCLIDYNLCGHLKPRTEQMVWSIFWMLQEPVPVHHFLDSPGIRILQPLLLRPIHSELGQENQRTTLQRLYDHLYQVQIKL